MSTPPAFIYLASQSPRRRQLLTQIGVPFELLLPDADEDAEALEAERAGESPEDYVARVTAAKLDAALARLQRRGWASAPVLCSDTTVAVEQRILGKPLDEADALATLQLLSGRRHRVITAVAVADGAKRWQTSSISHVDVAAVPTAALQRYIASGEPFGKAGSYAIQSLASAWISRIDGSYSGIMGLPLFETAQLLSNCGFEF
jgi:septum formation protein